MPPLVLGIAAGQAVQEAAEPGVPESFFGAAMAVVAVVPITIAGLVAISRIGRRSITRINVDHRIVASIVAASLILFVQNAPSSPYQQPWAGAAATGGPGPAPGGRGRRPDGRAVDRQPAAQRRGRRAARRSSRRRSGRPRSAPSGGRPRASCCSTPPPRAPTVSRSGTTTTGATSSARSAARATRVIFAADGIYRLRALSPRRRAARGRRPRSACAEALGGVVEPGRVGVAVGRREVELGQVVERDQVEVGVRHLDAGDHQPDPAGREGGLLGPPDVAGHLPEVGGEVVGEVDPVVDLVDRAPPACGPAASGAIEQEGDAAVVAPHEPARGARPR